MDKQALLGLGDKLLDIDEQRFRQVVGLLEHMDDHPEIRKTFSLIRPRLAEVKPSRRPTLKRLFCEPFEDLFEAKDKSGPAALNTIERDIINALWPLVEAQIGRERIQGFARALDPLSRSPDAQDVAQAFWMAAGEAVTTIALQRETGRFAEDLRLRLTPGRIRAVEDIARLLSVAPLVAELKSILAPCPVTRLHQDHLTGVQEIGRRLVKTRPEALRTFILLAASRLADPSLLLSALLNMDLGQTSGDRAALFLELGGIVVVQIEERTRDLKRAPLEQTDRIAVADLAVGLVASLEATRTAMEQGRNNAFDQRIKAVRGSVHEMVRAHVLESAATDIMGALDGLKSGAPLPGAADRDRLLRAENHARALRKCSTIADALGLRGELKDITQKATASLSETARTLLARGAAVGTNPWAGYAAVRMIELIAGPAAANQIMTEVLNSKG